MKVYELMKELESMPSGAEVKFRTLMTLKEFAECPIVDNDDCDLYQLDFTLESVEKNVGGTVFLYN